MPRESSNVLVRTGASGQFSVMMKSFGQTLAVVACLKGLTVVAVAQNVDAVESPSAKEAHEKAVSPLGRRIDAYLESPASTQNVLERARALAEEFERVAEAGDVERAKAIIEEIDGLKIDGVSRLKFYDFEREMRTRVTELARQKWVATEGARLLKEARRLCADPSSPLSELRALSSEFKDSMRVVGSSRGDIYMVGSLLNSWIGIRTSLEQKDKAAVVQSLGSFRRSSSYTLLVGEVEIDALLKVASKMKTPEEEIISSLKSLDELPHAIAQLESRTTSTARTHLSTLRKLDSIYAQLNQGRIAQALSDMSKYDQRANEGNIAEIFESLRLGLYGKVFKEEGFDAVENEDSMAFLERCLTAIAARDTGLEVAARLIKSLNPTQSYTYQDARWLYTEQKIIEDILSATRTEESGDHLYAVHRYRRALEGRNTSRLGLIEIGTARLKKLIERKPELSEAVIFSKLEEISAELRALKATSQRSRR